MIDNTQRVWVKGLRDGQMDKQEVVMDGKCDTESNTVKYK